MRSAADVRGIGPHTSPTSSDSALDKETVRKLKAAARAGRNLGSAQVQFLDIDELIQRSGSHWPAVSERLRTTSLSFLRGCINDDDLAIACDDGFLIVFADADPISLAHRTSELQEILTAFYCGEEGLETLRIQATARDITSDNLESIVARPSTTAFSGPTATSSKLDIVFWPVWAAQSELIAYYLCAPTYCDQGIVRPGYDWLFRLDGQTSGESFAETDFAILTKASAAMAQALVRNTGVVVGASVHITTLRRQKPLSRYLELLRCVPEAARRRMVIRVSEIEPGTPSANLLECTAMLRRHVRHVAFEFHHSDRTLGRLGSDGTWSVGFEAPQHTADPTPAARRDLIDLVDRWARACRLRGVRLHTGGWRNTALLAAARTAGIDFATSEITWPALREPSDIINAPLCDDVGESQSPRQSSTLRGSPNER